eukprot:m.29487 g.29487  ORF g.29487 m.29487 type:complete len:697 (+) comp4598_c0_seq1:74-2164(+)
MSDTSRPLRPSRPSAHPVYVPVLALCLPCVVLLASMQTDAASLVKQRPRACEVTVMWQISNKKCEENINFGCYETNNSMWVYDGCEAVFRCDDEINVTCESHMSPHVGPEWKVCPCVSDPNPPHKHNPTPPPNPPPAPPAPIPKCANRPDGVCPNIVFLIDESTDGRTYRPDGFAPTVLPNIRKLADSGVQFDTHYVNAPVCCPSRSSLWSGRYPHKIPHAQANNEDLLVRGVWNNYEGNPHNYTDLIGDVLQRRGYDVKISGKTDWTTGGHSLNVQLNSWTMYTRFPYNVNTSGGWYDENDCPENGTVAKSTTFKRHADWTRVDSTTDWITQQVAAQKKDPSTARPFFAYQGMDIVHPAYTTNSYWYAKIDQSKVTVPEWEPLADLHPCDFQSSMLKDCVPSNENAANFYSEARRKQIRTIYYAMITEFDAMVGEYMTTVEEQGISDNTVIIVTSDHGDMNMEHQQFYKMVQYDASSRVPLIIAGTGVAARGKFITAATQHVDLFPTIAAFAEVPEKDLPTVLDGSSLVPYLSASTDPVPPSLHPTFAVSQFHGCNIAMSWYLAVNGTYKYVVFGTGKEVPSQLFKLTDDVEEKHNLIDQLPEVVKEFDAMLRQVVDYPAVSLDVATYNQLSFRAWQNRTTDWQKQVATGRWSAPFAVDVNASFKAIEEWLSEPPMVKPCRSELVYPPSNHDEEL